MTWTEEVIGRWAGGEISPQIALARLLLSGEAPDPATLPQPLAELARAQGDRLGHLAKLARDGFDADDVAGAAALFDKLSASAPEAGVAFYALGDPALLARATDELVCVIRDWAPVENARVLDFGCGIGRVAAALAPHARDVVGVDVSSGMVAEAARRAQARNLRFAQVDGRTLAGFATGSIDLVVAADSFPFLVRAGVVDSALHEIARVLRPGGDLLVFNWSYRGDRALDLADAGAALGFDVVRAGEAPFAIWDGAGFHLRRR